MSGPPPALAAVRVAVRVALADLPGDARVLVALSGGADSLALLAASLHERPGRTAAAGGDHGWSPDSAGRAAEVAAVAGLAGADQVAVLTVPVTTGEAAAREERYRALTAEAGRQRAAAVLLGHTRDDQAETVLLGLARGSGARSLAGMARCRGVFRRPLLDLPRATTRAACAAAGLSPWQDPANTDPRFARARVRGHLLPVLEAELGPGVGAALARTADLLRDDADALDALAT
ncbi:MAG: tRNA lysidine(34) synthetase TilS, partial [Mycobacteriales bacterium]